MSADGNTEVGRRWLAELTRDVRTATGRQGKTTTRKQGDR